MIRLIQILFAVIISHSTITTAQNKRSVQPFKHVVISPHIEATLQEGNEESVTILNQEVTDDKINVEVKNGKLRIYLDDAKETTKQVKVTKNGSTWKEPLYKNKQLSVLITYKTLEKLSIRGEEKIHCKSKIKTENFTLTVYGESEVTFEDVKIQNLEVDIIGESLLTINKGKVDYQNIKVIGEAIINLENLQNRESKLKSVGEAEFRVNASEYIKFSAVGEAELYYKGKAKVNKGLSIGEASIYKLD